MDSNTWMEMANEVEPILRQLKQIAVNYKLGGNPLSIAVFADGNTWADYTEDDDDRHYFELSIEPNGAAKMSESKKIYVKS